MTLRPAVLNDTAELARLHASAFAAAWSAEEIGELLLGPGGFGLVAEDGGEAKGFILCRAVVGEAEVLTLAVEPAARRQGLASALMQSALTLARTVGAEVMFLEVAADNVAGVALYQGLGFERIGLRPGYYAGGGEAPVDALVYRLILDPTTHGGPAT